MADFNSYLKGVLTQVIDSYKLISNLKNTPESIDVMEREIAKINGLLNVVINKLDLIKNDSDLYVTLQKSISFYLESYDFSLEIIKLSELYADDPLRLKNLKNTILDSFNDKKLIVKIENFIESG